MAIQITGQSQGLLTVSQKSGSPASINTGWQNELLMTELLPRYFYLTALGLTFGAQWAAAATAAPSATAVGAFGLFNPPGSGKNLAIIDCTITQTTVTAATTVLQAGWQAIPNQTPTSQTATTVISNLSIGNSSASVAKALTAGTVVGAPTATFRNSFSTYTDLAAGDLLPTIKDVIDGAIIVAPNSTIALVSVANTPSVSLSMTWVELPI
jgi:hypothetical protein